MQAVPMEQMSEATLLDWLCLHVDPANLPRRSDSLQPLTTRHWRASHAFTFAFCWTVTAYGMRMVVQVRW